jgi:hypothetical protein
VCLQLYSSLLQQGVPGTALEALEAAQHARQWQQLWQVARNLSSFDVQLAKLVVCFTSTRAQPLNSV